MTDGGFPHSDIHGSRLACSSPWLFAAYRVLHRLLAPRHPPYALISLTMLQLSINGHLRRTTDGSSVEHAMDGIMFDLRCSSKRLLT